MELNRRDKDKYKNFGFKKNNFEEIIFNNNRFHAIYFVDYLTGSLLLSKKYSMTSSLCKFNEDLLSSFLNAMNLFINELNRNDDSNEEIQEINFKDTRILYERMGRLMVIGISKKTNLTIERNVLQNILLDFYDKFQNKIENFNGVIDQEILEYGEYLKSLNINRFYRFEFK